MVIVEITEHPLRDQMSDEDWDRMDRIVLKQSDEDCTTEELEAYMDYVYDLITSKKQTHLGSLTLQ